jgi:hypothetical protein
MGRSPNHGTTPMTDREIIHDVVLWILWVILVGLLAFGIVWELVQVMK